MNKEPGIYSADWAGRKRNFNLAIKKLYKKISNKDNNWKNKKIKARFICVLTIYWPNGKFLSKQVKLKEEYQKQKKGNNGFGYDPIFIPNGKRNTFGQMKPSKKYKLDHRYKAFNKIKKFF